MGIVIDSFEIVRINMKANDLLESFMEQLPEKECKELYRFVKQVKEDKEALLLGKKAKVFSYDEAVGALLYVAEKNEWKPTHNGEDAMLDFGDDVSFTYFPGKDMVCFQLPEDMDEVGLEYDEFEGICFTILGGAYLFAQNKHGLCV